MKAWLSYEAGMKKKSVRRIKRLLIALFTAVLLNVLLLLYFPRESVPDISGSGTAAGSFGETMDSAISAGSAAPQELQTGGGFGLPADSELSQKPQESDGAEGLPADSASSQKAEPGGASAGSHQPSLPGQILPTEPEDGASIPQQPEDTVTLCLAGDLMCLAGQQYTAERADGSHDYTDSFSLISGILESCDFAVANLETILSESNPYSTAERLVNEQPNCNAPADYLGSLKQAGFTHLVTANNHSLDGGAVGVRETIKCMEEYGFPHIGTYRPEDTGKRFLMLKKNGLCIALIAFTELVNQRESVTAQQLSRLIDCYGRQAAADRIAAARADGADFVIVYMHWGSENTHEVRAYQRQHAQELADAGADLIIGSHPHCLQEQEELLASDGRSVPCFYSLGNAVSSMTRDINHDTVLVLLTLQRSGSGQMTAEDAGQIPENTAQDPGNAGTSLPAPASIRKLELVPCHVLSALNGKYRVITPTSSLVEDKKAAAELAAAEERIFMIFPEYRQKDVP